MEPNGEPAGGILVGSENLRTILEAADMAVQDGLPDDATIEVTAAELVALAAAYRAAKARDWMETEHGFHRED